MRFVIRVVNYARYLICFYHACSLFQFHLLLLFALAFENRETGRYVTGSERVNILHIGGSIGRHPFSGCLWCGTW